MQKLRLLFSLFLLLLTLNTLDAHPDQSGLEKHLLHDWKKNTVIPSTARKPARTAILIIAPPVMGNCPISNRWKLGKKVWEQYMQSNPNVDCYFLVCAKPRQDEQIWLEENTIYVGDAWYEETGCDRLLHKTVAALEWLLPKYTHFIRTNINTFFDLESVNDYMETHHQSFYSIPFWQSAWYTLGYGIIFTADVADHIVKEYRRLDSIGEELISPYHSDDGALTSLATGVWPYDKIHPFRCCPTLPFGIRQLMTADSFSANRLTEYGALLTPPITLNEAIYYSYIAAPTVMLYRTREGFTLKELAQFYEYVLQKNYPELPPVDLVNYVESL